MRYLKFSEIIGKSFDRSALILFKPFSFKKWRGLIVIAFLAGTLSGGCNLNLGGGSPSKQANPPASTTSAQGATVSSVSAPGTDAEATSPSLPAATEPSKTSGNEDNFKSTLEFFKQTWKWWALGLVVMMALGIFLSWYLAPCRFVWTHSVINNESSFWQPFKKYRGEGNHFFVFFMIFGLVSLAVVGLLVGIGLLLARQEGLLGGGAVWSFGAVFRAVIIPLLFLMIYFIAAGIVSTVIMDFGVPIMIDDHCSVGKSWGSFVEIYKGHTKDFWLYLLIKIGLQIMSGILGLLILLVGILAFLLAGLVIFGLPYLIFMLLLKWNIFFIVLAFLLLVPFIFFLAYFLFAVNLPFAVFFQCFALYFLSSFKTRYQPLPIE